MVSDPQQWQQRAHRPRGHQIAQLVGFLTDASSPDQQPQHCGQQQLHDAPLTVLLQRVPL